MHKARKLNITWSYKKISFYSFLLLLPPYFPPPALSLIFSLNCYLWRYKKPTADMSDTSRCYCTKAAAPENLVVDMGLQGYSRGWHQEPSGELLSHTGAEIITCRDMEDGLRSGCSAENAQRRTGSWEHPAWQGGKDTEGQVLATSASSWGPWNLLPHTSVWPPCVNKTRFLTASGKHDFVSPAHKSFYFLF